jgi:hypothetical protein
LDIPRARIMTFGYNANIFCSSYNTISDHAGLLLEHLRAGRRGSEVDSTFCFDMPDLTQFAAIITSDCVHWPQLRRYRHQKGSVSPHLILIKPHSPCLGFGYRKGCGGLHIHLQRYDRSHVHRNARIEAPLLLNLATSLFTV